MTAKINKVIAILIWVVSGITLALESTPLYAFLFFVPFALFPHGINHLLIYKLSSLCSQYILLLGQLMYFGWYIYIYIDTFYVNLDAQSGLVMLFVGIYSLPVMAVVWFTANSICKKYA
jgi:hypothetical protein